MAWSALGLDRSIAITVLNRAWALAAGPATLMLVALSLNPVEQGFYFAFASVLGLQVFFELGLGFVVMQTVSHGVAALRVERTGLQGDEAARARLGRLLADVLRWYTIVAVVFIVLISIGGGAFLGAKGSDPSIAWQRPWAFVVPVFGLSIVVNALFSFLEGLGFVADVALARLAQSVLGMSGLWFALMGGQKLMALVALHSLNLLVGAGWLVWRFGPLLRQTLAARGARGLVDWRRDIWPFQWRIAASWTAGYCGTQAVTLILFQQLDPAQAGRFGLTLAATSALASGATAWITTKAPRFGRLVASGAFAELDQLYRGAFRGAMAVGVFGAVLLMGIVAGLDALQLPLARRFVPLPALLAMTLAILVGIRVAAQASYLRSFRREPYLGLSVATGVAQVAVALAMTFTGDVSWVAIGYSVVSIAIGMFWAPALFTRLRREYAPG